MTPLSERQVLVGYIQDAVADGSRLEPACNEADIALRTFRRWVKQGEVQEDKRPVVVRKAPANKLSEAEKDVIVTTCNSPAFASLPPSQIVPRLADQGIYHASESSFYRVLHEREQVQHRGKSRQKTTQKVPETYIAQGPNQVWSWDITYCHSTVVGRYYYLYLIEDVFSRKIVGWEIYEVESGEYAAELLQRTLLKEQCFTGPPVLHSDNGAPMKSYTMKAKMEALGVTGSHSRPGVSNDNPFSESLFKTMKYCPQWPSKGFADIDAARHWVNTFAKWYNEEHCHSGIEFVTPAQRHRGQDKAVLEKRCEVYEAARKRHPERWSGQVRRWEYQATVSLNPVKTDRLKMVALT